MEETLGGSGAACLTIGPLMERPQAIESSNYAKFQTSNPIVLRQINRFYDRLQQIVVELAPDSVLDAGCGEGETLARLGRILPSRVAAIDLSPEAVAFTARRLPQAEVLPASVYDLPFDDSSFELVLCLEVLEHLRDPAAALTELTRISSRAVLISVPEEPWFRLGSLFRGKYLRRLGNHPEHINHWGPKSLSTLLDSHLEIVDLPRAFPWLIANCRVLAPNPPSTSTAGH